jgi:hypothetical protein
MKSGSGLIFVIEIQKNRMKSLRSDPGGESGDDGGFTDAAFTALGEQDFGFRFHD